VSDPKSWRQWIGREQVVEDVMDPARAEALHATLGRPGAPPTAGDPLPPLWHWIYFWSIAPMSALGRDGHLALGHFLPPIDLPRRMWAGSRFTFHRSPILGAPAERTSNVADVTMKQGRSGPLAFVTVHHRVSDSSGVCIEEEQDLVFRGAPEPASDPVPAKVAAPDTPAWVRRVTADPVLLFRFSALLFNGHRIHYDGDYARDTEGYPGLVVHGPLLGLLMCQLALDESAARQPASYRFRLSQPIFAPQGFAVAGSPLDGGREARLWVQNEDGELAAEGRLVFT
jgi:3-methylfumaryl-CoA hydratase